jgi:hypothetical protein
MTEYELLRIISFLERMRKPYDQLLPVAEPDQNWNMVIFLMRSYLRGQTVSMSSLAQSAEVPFASASTDLLSWARSRSRRRRRDRGRFTWFPAPG